MRRPLLVAPLALVLLTGCASSPEAEVRDDVTAVLAAANDEDAEAVRSTVDELLATLREQVGSGELTAEQAEPVRAAALAVRDSVVELEVEPTPTPTPTPSPTEEPTPEPEPTEEPEEPEVTEGPEPTEPDEGDDGGGDDAEEEDSSAAPSPTRSLQSGRPVVPGAPQTPSTAPSTA